MVYGRDHLLGWLVLFGLVCVSEQRVRCGQRVRQSHRFLKGFETTRGDHPWIASLEYTFDRKTWEHVCSAVIIHRRWVVVAAHCFIDPYDRAGTLKRLQNAAVDYRIVAGDYVKKFDSEASEHYFKPDRIVVNSRSKEAFVKNGAGDIALVKVNGTFIVDSQWTREACRPRASTRFDGRPCVVVGWGQSYVSTDEIPPSVQEYYNSTIVPLDECIAADDSGRLRVDPSMVCVKAAADPESDAIRDRLCSGDSGAVLICETGGGFHVAGLAVSNEVDTCVQRHDLFTKYSAYSRWILKIIRKDAKDERKLTIDTNGEIDEFFF